MHENDKFIYDNMVKIIGNSTAAILNEKETFNYILNLFIAKLLIYDYNTSDGNPIGKRILINIMINYVNLEIKLYYLTEHSHLSKITPEDKYKLQNIAATIIAIRN